MTNPVLAIFWEGVAYTIFQSSFILYLFAFTRPNRPKNDPENFQTRRVKLWVGVILLAFCTTHITLNVFIAVQSSHAVDTDTASSAFDTTTATIVNYNIMQLSMVLVGLVLTDHCRFAYGCTRLWDTSKPIFISAILLFEMAAALVANIAFLSQRAVVGLEGDWNTFPMGFKVTYIALMATTGAHSILTSGFMIHGMTTLESGRRWSRWRNQSVVNILTDKKAMKNVLSLLVLSGTPYSITAAIVCSLNIVRIYRGPNFAFELTSPGMSANSILMNLGGASVNMLLVISSRTRPGSGYDLLLENLHPARQSSSDSTDSGIVLQASPGALDPRISAQNCEVGIRRSNAYSASQSRRSDIHGDLADLNDKIEQILGMLRRPAPPSYRSRCGVGRQRSSSYYVTASAPLSQGGNIV